MNALHISFAGPIARVTLNRPEVRNALSRQVLAELHQAVGEADRRHDVAVVVLTGADPAFCAGLDLKEVGADGGPLRTVVDAAADARGAGGLLPTGKPLIGAVNGVAVTGGLELALRCDFLVASERARFADTHARVGVQPLWGLTALLPQAVGLRRAREMSATGNFVDAAAALAWGLVNHVVPHQELLPFTLRLAADVVSNDQRALATLWSTYDQGSRTTVGDALAIETERGLVWQHQVLDFAEVERRRRQVVDRGRASQPPVPTTDTP